MAKFCLKKKSKRQPARLRYKIEKKVRDHNRKIRKEAKKNPKSKKPKMIQIPNICPFKEDILKEVEALKKQNEEEKKKAREAAKLERQKQTESRQKQTLESMVQNAETRGKIHSALTVPQAESSLGNDKKKENSLRTFYKEFRKVIENADVVLEVLDARDPLGTRCVQVEEAVHQAGSNKRLVLILNKADLVPKDILDKWLKYLRQTVPAVPFKASTQQQNKRLGRRKLKSMKTAEAMKNSTCIGAELLMSVLANYCRNKDIKTSIRVGVVGLPNVGKSSIINSLKRSRACNVGSTPGVTKQMQEVQLDSKIKLLDSPGVVFAASSVKNDSSVALKNAIKVGSLKDPFEPATAVLKRVNKQHIMEMYDIPEYSTPQEFYALKAKRTGRLKKGGVPDTESAARDLLEDWNSGKIKYYTVPPEDPPASSVHIDAVVVKEIAKEFDIDNFEMMETETLASLEARRDQSVANFTFESSGPIEALNLETEEKMEQDTAPDSNGLLPENVNTDANKKKRKNRNGNVVAKKKKIDPEMELEGNLKTNNVKKLAFKKMKKIRNRRDKVATALSEGLVNFTISENDDYNFSTDYKL